MNRQYGALGLLAAVVAVVSVLIWNSPFWIDTSILAAVFSLLALSAGMNYGQAGISSFATAAFASTGAYATTILTVRFGVSAYIGLMAAVLVPVIIAYPIARVVTRLSHLPLSIATIALSAIVEVAIREGGDITGGYVGISGIPPIPFFRSPISIHLLAWTIVLAVLAAYINLMLSSFGRAVRTARHDALRATADGVNVGPLLAKFFAFSAGTAGLGGWLYAHYVTYLGPESLNTTTSVTVLLMAIVGGAQSFLGPIIGATILTILTIYLPAAETQGMAFGATLIVVMLLAPRGLDGEVRRALSRYWPSKMKKMDLYEGAHPRETSGQSS
jgi:branched-chain amino acid transport system permease protein